MASEVIDVASLVARGYSHSGKAPGGRFGVKSFWPWVTILAGMGAVGLFAGTVLTVYRLLQFFSMVAWLGLSSGS